MNMKYKRLLVLIAFFVVLVALGIAITQRATVTADLVPNSPTPVINRTGGTAYYVDNDGPVAVYRCASIDCEVITTFTNGIVVSVVGPPQGDDLLPISYQNTTVYVMDTWLALQPNTPALSTSRELGGATARCRDGWISYSKHHQGTCSHHKGVSQWYQ